MEYSIYSNISQNWNIFLAIQIFAHYYFISIDSAYFCIKLIFTVEYGRYVDKLQPESLIRANCFFTGMIYRQLISAFGLQAELLLR